MSRVSRVIYIVCWQTSMNRQTLWKRIFMSPKRCSFPIDSVILVDREQKHSPLLAPQMKWIYVPRKTCVQFWQIWIIVKLLSSINSSLQSVGASCVSSHFLIFRVLREGKKGGQMADARARADAGVCHGGIAHPFAVDLPRLRRPMKNKHAAVKYRAAPKETSKVVLIWGEASIKKYHSQQFQDVWLPSSASPHTLPQKASSPCL